MDSISRPMAAAGSRRPRFSRMSAPTHDRRNSLTASAWAKLYPDGGMAEVCCGSSKRFSGPFQGYRFFRRFGVCGALLTTFGTDGAGPTLRKGAGAADADTV